MRLPSKRDAVRPEQPSRLFTAEEHWPMCDYSLHNVKSRPAKVGDKLVSTKFASSITHGFAAVGEPNVAVCLLPGTEVSFESDVEYRRAWGMFPNRKAAGKVARFRQINAHDPRVHHDALEFPSGQTVLVNELCEGQQMTVLQLPASLPVVRDAKEAMNQDENVLMS